MAGYIGKLDEYDSNSDWGEYIERLNEYFVANELEGEDEATTQRAILLSTCGAKTYSQIRNLLALAVKPNTKTFVELTELVKTHLSPKPLVIAERFRINNRKQLETETVREYMRELRRMAETCAFF